MSDSSEEEDMSRFREAVDTAFIKLIDSSKCSKIETKDNSISERYLHESTHYNDVKVPEVLQKQIANKISNIINNKFEFIDVQPVKKKKRKLKGGVKLFKESTDFLSCEDAVDSYTENHNKESKRLRNLSCDDGIDASEKIKSACIDGEYILSKEETKLWKSRRKEKIFRYKKNGKRLLAIE